MANFKEAFDKVVLHEGGYANDPDDKGGETFLGISRKAHPNSSIWQIIDDVKRTNGIKNINHILKRNTTLITRIEYIYKEEYWDRFELDKVKNQKVANEIFDDAVNRGVSSACILVSATLGMTPVKTITDELLINLSKL